MKDIERFFYNDIYNPKHLFHGSPYDLNILDPRKAHDNNSDNQAIDNGIHLTSSFMSAICYAFRKSIRELNDTYHIEINNQGYKPAMKISAPYIPEDLSGFVYVFNNDDDMFRTGGYKSTQYICYKEIKPIRKIEVFFKDYKDYFEIDDKKRVLK